MSIRSNDNFLANQQTIAAEKPLHIVIVGPAYPLRGGGMATFNERLALQFQQEGHQVTIYTFSLQYPPIFFPGSTQLSDTAPPKDLTIKVAINSINPFNWITVGKELKKLRADIIVVRYWLPFMGPCLGTILRIAKQNKISKIVCIADNIIPHEKRIADTSFTRYFVKPVDAFITMSKQVLEDVKTFAPNTAAVFVPHPLYDNFGDSISGAEARKLLALPHDAFVLLFFGFVRKYKGLDLLLKAMPAVIASIPNVLLVIAGEFYEEEKQYHSLIDTLRLHSHVKLEAGFIGNADIPKYFCAADVVVQPYKNATQSGVTPLAIHYEVPTVVTNVGGLADMVEHKKTGMVAMPNPQSLAENIIALASLGKAHFIPNIQEQKSLYSWDKMTGTILKLATLQQP